MCDEEYDMRLKVKGGNGWEEIELFAEVVDDDGAVIHFDIHCSDGEYFTICCSAHQLNELIEKLTQIGSWLFNIHNIPKKEGKENGIF